jgi:hypothetical protein
MVTSLVFVATEPDDASPSSLRYLRSLRASALSFDFHAPSQSKAPSTPVAPDRACASPVERASDNQTHNSFKISVCGSSASVDSKAFTRTLNPLETTFAEKPGVGIGINNPNLDPSPSASVLISLHLYEGHPRTRPTKSGKMLGWWQGKMIHS